MEPATDAVIGLDDLFAAGTELPDEAAVRRAVAHVATIEPYLAGYLDREVIHVAGRLALAGGSPALCRETANLLMTIALTVFTAQRKASNRLWSDVTAAAPLAEVPKAVPPHEEK